MTRCCSTCRGWRGNNLSLHEGTATSQILPDMVLHCSSRDHQLFHLDGKLKVLGMAYLKEFVLIDDDDDGDMSLREKTVTDISVMDGNAADLVCGRLFTTSSDSLSEDKEECLAPEAPPTKEVQTSPEKRCCCFCTLS
uniref:Uncharacterized protein n=1 Tax=Echeneis naucrates TaxID=173247 RepID=A0A665WSB4_ECHNA